MGHLFRLAMAGIPALLLFIVTLFQPGSAVVPIQQTGADLLIQPKTVDVAVGDTFSVQVYVNAYESINVVRADLLYPNNVLKITDIDTNKSIITLWVTKPADPENTGSLHFSGGIYGAGYEGNGKILTVTFLAEKEGNIDLTLDNALVLAHDGQGTPVLQNVQNSKVEISKEGPTPAVSSQELTPTPSSAVSRLRGDINGDGKVNTVDLGMMLSGMQESYNSKFDLNGDGRVDMMDLGIVLSGLGK